MYMHSTVYLKKKCLGKVLYSIHTWHCPSWKQRLLEQRKTLPAHKIVILHAYMTVTYYGYSRSYTNDAGGLTYSRMPSIGV